ncbi:amidohydrolase family protein [Actinoplanes solisilvae]|uniref:amidohydrolase family protein n=1 Tax=Actinoplanes solisilvae TaxID=2486853 RepID=UPI000FD7AA30|nr:amidohydrolase family protein [Actinoplanes solisilvae]
MIDAHLHLWDPAVLPYPWLSGRLDRAFRPADLDTGGRQLTAAVFIEAGVRADRALDEVAWVESLAREWPVLAGIVAQAPLDRGEAAGPVLRELAARPLVKGVRHNLQGARVGAPLTEEHLTGVRLLAGLGLSADLTIDAAQLPEVTELARIVPEVTFVLDHVGNPRFGPAERQPWADRLARLAERPNVVVKLSGLTGADPGLIHDRLTHAVAVFGADRCLFGGDWPVSPSYASWAETVAGVADLDVLAGTARRVYRLASSSAQSSPGIG